MLSAELKQALLEGARIYDLGQPLQMGIPVYPSHPPYIFTLVRRHGDTFRPCGYSSANDLIVMCAHTGTHFDGPAHISEEGKLYGGVDAAEAQRGPRGLKQLGIETVAPVLARGVLLDVAGHQGVEVLPPGYAVTADDLAATAAAEGVEVRRGDVVLVRTGWIQHYGDAPRYLGLETGAPGPDASAAEWLVERGIRASGCDTLAYEVTRPGDEAMPVHLIFIARNGVAILEAVNCEELARDRVYDFIFTCAPLKFVGGTGSPVRPIAIA